MKAVGYVLTAVVLAALGYAALWSVNQQTDSDFLHGGYPSAKH